MRPVHVQIDAPDPFERGVQRGRFAAHRLQCTWPIYRQLIDVTADIYGGPRIDVSAVAEASLDSLTTWSPALLRELEGVAQGSGLELLTVMSINARTEALALARDGTTECSTVVQLRGRSGTSVSAQTWDWHYDLVDGWHVQTVRGNEHAFVGLTEYGMLAKIGMNDAGLGLHLNLLRHASDGRTSQSEASYGDPAAPIGGVPVHLVAREILGRASTVAEAADLAASAPLTASTVLTVVTEDDAVCLEMCPDGVAVLRPQSGWLVHANHFLDPVLAEGERVMFDLTTTLERQELLSARSKAVDEPLDAEGLARLLAAHDEDGVAVCRHVDRQAPMGYRTATLATVALDPAARSAAVSAGGPGERRDVVTLTATP